MFKWIPGHKGMEGNEKANEQVKKAITEGSSNAQNLPKMLKDTLPHSKSALKQAHNKKLNRKAQKIWKIKNLPRCLANVLTQLWMGHAPLAKHLHCIKKGLNDLSQLFTASGNHTTLLTALSSTQDARQILHYNTERNIDIKKLFTQLKILQAHFKYVADTGKFYRNMEAAIPPN